jgi:hypothetical protein
MNPFSRRSLLRLGGASGAAAVVAATPLTPSHAALAPVVAWLDQSVVVAGESLVLHVEESLRADSTTVVLDTSGLVWNRSAIGTGSGVWTAQPTTLGHGMILVVTIREDGDFLRTDLTYDVVSSLIGGSGPLIGMSAPADVWARRVAEVGAGLAARRIFADLGGGAGSQLQLVEAAHEAGLMPVVSYKVGGDIAGASSGALDRVAAQAAALLAAFDRPTAVTVWHEPYGDMTGAQYAALTRRLLPVFRRDELRVGPILNGWLLDNQLDTFGSYCPDDLFELWDWFGIDTYHSGTPTSPGERTPAERIRALPGYLESRGFDLPMGIGEYNGFTADVIAEAGEAILSTPNMWFGCMWNSTEGQGLALSDDRLAAFRATLADPRAAELVLP